MDGLNEDWGSAKQCFSWDITFRLPNEKYPTWKHLHRKVSKYFKKFTFSKELGKEGHEHYQFRGSLFKKTAKKHLKDVLLPTFGGYWTPTVAENIGNYAYIKKEETHIDGPWDQDTACGDEPRMLPDIQEYIDLGPLPWHTRALEYCRTTRDFRKIMVVIDEKGEHGKNSFKRWLRYMEYSNDVPATMMDAHKMMEFVFNNEELGCFTFNFPRAMKLDCEKGRQLAIAVEALKDGDVYDTRYKGRSKPIPRPQILVLCNHFFPLAWLTMKRYIFLILDDTKENGYTEMNAQEYQNILDMQAFHDSLKVAQKAQKAAPPKKKKRMI